VQPLTPQLIEAEIREAIADGDTERIIKGQLILDTRAAKQLPGLCASALWYASKGLHVFPVQAGGKIPYRGFKWRDEASTNMEAIRGWWTRWPDANIGIATGHLVDVFDIDGPPDGTQSASKHLAKFPKVYGKVSTPRPGGVHYYVAATGRGNGAKIFPGIDHRGLGGYVVAPPSRTAEGHYVWYQPLELSDHMTSGSDPEVAEHYNSIRLDEHCIACGIRLLPRTPVRSRLCFRCLETARNESGYTDG
jgi:hypothetical protein